MHVEHVAGGRRPDAQGIAVSVSCAAAAVTEDAATQARQQAQRTAHSLDAHTEHAYTSVCARAWQVYVLM